MSDGNLTELQMYSNDWEYTVSFRHDSIICQSGEACVVKGDLEFGRGISCEHETAFFLTGWKIDGQFNSKISALMVDLRKDYETCDTDGRKAVRFSAEIRADFETAQSYTVEYDFAVMVYRTFNAATGVLENSCTYNPFLPGCIGTATLGGAVPQGSGFQFIGFALQKFEMHTGSGRPVALVRARVDASVLTVMSPEDRQQ